MELYKQAAISKGGLLEAKLHKLKPPRARER